MKDDTDKQLEDVTLKAINKIEELLKSVHTAAAGVEYIANKAITEFRKNGGPRHPGERSTLQLRFQLEEKVEHMRDSLRFTRAKRVDTSDLEGVLTSGREELAEMETENPTDPRVTIRKYHLELLQTLLTRNKEILAACDHADSVIKSVDEIIMELQ